MRKYCLQRTHEAGVTALGNDGEAACVAVGEQRRDLGSCLWLERDAARSGVFVEPVFVVRRKLRLVGYDSRGTKD